MQNEIPPMGAMEGFILRITWIVWNFILWIGCDGMYVHERELAERFHEMLFRNDYLNHQLFQITVQNMDELSLLKLWRSKYAHLGMDFWDDSLPNYYTSQKRDFLLRVPPQSTEELSTLLATSGIQFQVLSTDLKRLIQWEKWSISDLHSHRGLISPDTGRYQSHRRILLPGIQTLSTYLSLDSVYEFIDSIVLRYPLMATSFDIGHSFEGRPIRGIKIGSQFPMFKDTDYEDPQAAAVPVKKAVLLDGAMQGRDWISVPTLLYLTQQLLAKYDIDEDNRILLDYYDWYIIPVVNPDGYNYSWTTDRLWKKTRSISISNGTLNDLQCRGVDLNRNFAFNWGETNDPESGMDDVCEKSYVGDRPFSERESTALGKFIFNNRKQIRVYATLQNYGQNILFPYAGNELQPKNHRDLILAANVATIAMHRVHGQDYGMGSFAETLYEAGGTSLDWAYEVAKIKYSYQFQLRDHGHWGYLLPRNQIIPAAAEFFAGITELVRFVHFYELRPEV